MEQLIKELIRIEKERNLLLKDISKSLKTISTKDVLSEELFKQIQEEAEAYFQRTSKPVFINC